MSHVLIVSGKTSVVLQCWFILILRRHAEGEDEKDRQYLSFHPVAHNDKLKARASTDKRRLRRGTILLAHLLIQFHCLSRDFNDDPSLLPRYLDDHCLLNRYLRDFHFPWSIITSSPRIKEEELIDGDVLGWLGRYSADSQQLWLEQLSSSSSSSSSSPSSLSSSPLSSSSPSSSSSPLCSAPAAEVKATPPRRSERVAPAALEDVVLPQQTASVKRRNRRGSKAAKRRKQVDATSTTEDEKDEEEDDSEAGDEYSDIIEGSGDHDYFDQISGEPLTDPYTLTDSSGHSETYNRNTWNDLVRERKRTSPLLKLPFFSFAEDDFRFLPVFDDKRLEAVKQWMARKRTQELSAEVRSTQEVLFSDEVRSTFERSLRAVLLHGRVPFDETQCKAVMDVVRKLGKEREETVEAEETEEKIAAVAVLSTLDTVTSRASAPMPKPTWSTLPEAVRQLCPFNSVRIRRRTILADGNCLVYALLLSQHGPQLDPIEGPHPSYEEGQEMRRRMRATLESYTDYPWADDDDIPRNGGSELGDSLWDRRQGVMGVTAPQTRAQWQKKFLDVPNAQLPESAICLWQDTLVRESRGLDAAPNVYVVVEDNVVGNVRVEAYEAPSNEAIVLLRVAYPGGGHYELLAFSDEVVLSKAHTWIGRLQSEAENKEKKGMIVPPLTVTGLSRPMYK
jgi:hypothetical protein